MRFIVLHGHMQCQFIQIGLESHLPLGLIEACQSAIWFRPGLTHSIDLSSRLTINRNYCTIGSMTKKIIFLGTSVSMGIQIETAERLGYEIMGIIDSDWFGNRDTFCSVPVINSQTIFETDPTLYQDVEFFICVNWNPMDNHRDATKRKQFIELVNRYQLPCANLISDLSYVSRFASLGKNVFVGNATTIEPDCVIEDFVCIMDNVTLGHHSRIGHNSVMQRMSSLKGTVGHDSYVGIGSMIFSHHGCTVGNNVDIGPGLYVSRDVKDNEQVRLDRHAVKIYRNPTPSQ
jgi:carbonic anhydrase/acetyltransferase-like protein (isoleucine patch superfamily)